MKKRPPVVEWKTATGDFCTVRKYTKVEHLADIVRERGVVSSIFRKLVYKMLLSCSKCGKDSLISVISKSQYDGS